MKPTIKRSVVEGFKAASRSWPALGLFAGCWMLVMLLNVFAIGSTNIPARLFGPTHIAEKADISASTSPKATDKAQVTVAPEEKRADIDAGQARQIEQWLRRAWPLLTLCFLVAVVVGIWLQGGQIGYLDELVKQGHASISIFRNSANSAFGALIGASVLGFLAAALAVLLGVAVAVTVALLSNVLPGWLVAVLSILLFLAGIVAIIWVSLRIFMFWNIAIVVEKIGPINGLKRSFCYTRGYAWRLFGLALILALMYIGLNLIWWLIGLLGSVAGSAGGLMASLLNAMASIFIGFAVVAMLLRWYEDAKSPESSADALGQAGV